MEHKVTIKNDIGSGTTVVQEFVAVVDGEDEAFEFGANACTLQMAFVNGYGSVNPDAKR